MRGITLLCIGSNNAYMYFCSNMMLSIKKNSGLPVQLVTTEGYINHLPEHERYYDVITYMKPEDYTLFGNFNPGKGKLNIYPYLEWDETIYLDIDGIILKEVEPLFDFDGIYKTQWDIMHWAEDDEIRQHFGVEGEIIGLNSSVQVIRKCKKVREMFEDAARLIERPFPQDKQKNNWFGWFPDELYMSIAIKNAGIDDPYWKEKFPVYFRTKNTYGGYRTVDEITKEHYVVGCYGGERYNHLNIKQIYDKLVHKWSVELYRQNIKYKYDYLMGAKHVGKIRRNTK